MATNNSTIYLLQYNNYFNRIIKRETSIADYLQYQVYDNILCNFNPADGIDTEHVINIPYVANTPTADYAVVVDTSGTITSRWFIINATRTRGGQYRISLHRDVIADYYDNIVNAPCYVERASLTTSNPLIYNSENLSVNQIKRGEFLLKDATQTPWVVIYFNRNQTEAKTITANADVIDNSDLVFSYETMRALEGQTILGNQASDAIASFTANYYPPELIQLWQKPGYFSFSSDGTTGYYNKIADTTSATKYTMPYNKGPAQMDAWNALINTNKYDVNNYIYTVNNTTNRQSIIDTLKTLKGKTFKDDNSDTYYSADITVGFQEITFTVPVNSGLYNNLDAGIKAMPEMAYILDGENKDSNSITISCNIATATVSNVQVVEGIGLRMVVPASSGRNSLTDAPWDMLAIPYGEVWVRTEPTASVGTLPNVARAIAQSAQANLGDFVADVQLLPYCPCMEYVSNGRLNLSNLTQGVHYSSIVSDEDDLPASFGIWCNQSSFSVNITGFTPIANPVDAIEFKVNNECDMYRLVSPNYSGAFQFSATKNGGILGFEANCTYKPYQPYIHINPIFGGLYGSDFNDNRGLVCGGNFSMSSSQDAWTNYQISNKSYKESFDRQITNMETTYDIQRNQMKDAAKLSIISAAIGTGAGGATAGMMTMGSLGAAAGLGAATGFIGAATSAWGAQQDLMYADQLFNESRSYATDQFNLSLDNIKALPNTVSNVGAFDINYKYFPFLEYYTCTEEEKEALRNKIRYNGMTVNVIGAITDYITGENQFVQGQLIRLEGIAEDYHTSAAIAQEIHKGVYI